jgi:hypothetical protein
MADLKDLASRYGVLKDKLNAQDFGPNDSIIASSLMHPQEAAGRASDWLQEKMRIASGRPYEENFTPDQQTQAGLDLAGLMQTGAMPFAPASAGGTLGMAIKAYHGSPHLFDRFDMSKIGTGEGAQAYGHGLYFAQEPSIAEGYQKALSGGSYIDKHGMPVPVNEITSDIYEAARKGGADIKEANDASSFWSLYLKDGEKMSNTPGYKYIKDVIDKRGIKFKNKGNIYETSIQWPNAEREAMDPLGEHHLLDWNQPVEGYVQEAIPKKIKELRNSRDAIDSKYTDGDFNPDDLFANIFSFPSREDKTAIDRIAEEINMHKYMSSAFEKGAEGSVIYNKLIKMLGSPEKASEYLHSIDIPGIKYLDATSRRTDKGTRNFVTFGDEYPEITKRAGSMDELQEKNLNKRLIEKYLSKGKLSPDDMAQYEQNALAMETPLLQRYNVENAEMQIPNTKQRAKSIGFMTQPSKEQYHLTRNDWENNIPDLTKSDLGFHTGSIDQANYRGKAFDDNAVGQSVIPIAPHKYTNYLKLNDLGSFHSDSIAPQLEKKKILAKGKAKQIQSAIDNDWKLTDQYDQQMRDVLSQHDIDAIKYANEQEGEGLSYAHINPSMIRSRFAAFDPLRKNSSSIMASGLLGDLALKYANDDEPKYAQGGIVKAQDQNENLGKLAEMLGSARDVGNEYTVPSWVPLAGGVGAGDLLMGKTPEEIENWSYGNAPMQIPEMSNVPQFKRGRAQSLADALTTLAPGVKATEDLPVGLAIKGYHGSPHKFKEFDTAHMGTGEGGQAYGWGNYITEDPYVATTYSPQDDWMDEQLMNLYSQAERRQDYPSMEVYERYMMHERPNEIKEYLNESYADYPEDLPKRLPAQKIGENLYKKQKGSHLYEVSMEFPKEREAVDPMSIEHFLDYDKPLSEQSDYVRNILQSHDPDMYHPEGPDYDPAEKGNSILQRFGSGKEGAQKLYELGIPGTTYMGEKAKVADPEGVRNFVTYSDEVPRVVTRNMNKVKPLTDEDRLNDLEKQMSAYMKTNRMPKGVDFKTGSDWFDWAYDKRAKLRGYAEGGSVSMEDLPFNDPDQLRLYHQAMQHFDDLMENTGGSKKMGKTEARINYNTTTKGDRDRDKDLHTLIADYGVDVGKGVNLNATMIKPMEAEGVYLGNLSGSVPVGEGRASLGLQGLHTKYSDGLSGYTAGYNGKVGDGDLSASYFEPADHNSAGRQVQLEYSMPFADGGSVSEFEDPTHERLYRRAMAHFDDMSAKQNFEDNDSMIASTILHPVEAAKRAGKHLNDMYAVATDQLTDAELAAAKDAGYDEESYPLYAMEHPIFRTDAQKAEAGMEFAGLAQTGAMPFAPSTGAGVLGTITIPKKRITVTDPERSAFPDIYDRPDEIARRAAQNVAEEDPAMKRLFGVNRDDLYEIRKARAEGNESPAIVMPVKPKGAKVGPQVTTRRNANRIIDTLSEAMNYPDLYKGMTSWYENGPLYDRLAQISDTPIEDFKKFQTYTGMASPGSDVLTELNRGTAALTLANQGRLDDFIKYGGIKSVNRNNDFPEDLHGVKGHMYHLTAHAKPMKKYYESGEIQMETPKVPLYIQSAGVPETGYQTEYPVGDAHWSRAVGLGDVRTSQKYDASVSTPELLSLAPWWKGLSKKLGLNSVDSQALAWGTFAPATGVDTPVGASKLELLSRKIMEAARAYNITPEEARDMILTGKMYAPDINSLKSSKK